MEIETEMVMVMVHEGILMGMAQHGDVDGPHLGYIISPRLIPMEGSILSSFANCF